MPAWSRQLHNRATSQKEPETPLTMQRHVDEQLGPAPPRTEVAAADVANGEITNEAVARGITTAEIVANSSKRRCGSREITQVIGIIAGRSSGPVRNDSRLTPGAGTAACVVSPLPVQLRTRNRSA